MTEKQPGNPRTPLRWWDTFGKTVVGIDHQGTSYEIEIDYFEWDDEASLYRDSKFAEQRSTPQSSCWSTTPGSRLITHRSASNTPALVTSSGTTPIPLIPESFEYKRLRWDEANPSAAKVIAAISWVALALAAILGIPQLLELLSGSGIAERIGFSFTSPFNLPGSANTTLSILAFVAAIERGTRMKYNWWLDGQSDDFIDFG